MQNGNAYYRLGVSLLALTLLFLGVQSIQWSPSVSAQITTSAKAGIVSATVNQPPSEDIIDITEWGYVINAPGTYRLAHDLSGTNGIGVKIASADVTLLGNGHAIIGDHLSEGFEDREVGISVDGASQVKIMGIKFQQLELGIQTNMQMPSRGTSLASSPDSLEGLEITDNLFNNIYVAMDLWNPSGTYVNRGTLKNNRVETGWGGILLSNEGNFGTLAFENNRLSQVEYPFYVGTYGDQGQGSIIDVTVTGNEFMGASYGVKVSNNGGNLGQVEFSDNDLRNFADSSTTDLGAHVTFRGGASHVDVWGNQIEDGSGMHGIKFDGQGQHPTDPPGSFNDVNVFDNSFMYLTCNDMSGPPSAVFFSNLPNNGMPPAMVAGHPNLDAQLIPRVWNNLMEMIGGPGVAYEPSLVNPVPYIDARDNWWGDPAGPNGPQGTGVSDHVLFEPWLSSPPIFGTPTPTATVPPTATATSTPASNPLFLPVLLRQG